MGTSGTSYDDSGIDIKVDPTYMYTLAMDAMNDVIGMHDDLEHIIATLNDLELSWYGPSQAELNDFNHRWSIATTALFGTKENPGVLVKFVLAIAMAAQNYGNIEEDQTKRWKEFAAALNAPASDKPDTAFKDITEPPITETFS
jgi:hypothetical protein